MCVCIKICIFERGKPSLVYSVSICRDNNLDRLELTIALDRAQSIDNTRLLDRFISNVMLIYYVNWPIFC